MIVGLKGNGGVQHDKKGVLEVVNHGESLNIPGFPNPSSDSGTQGGERKN